jgi:diaminopimelate epimerase
MGDALQPHFLEKWHGAGNDFLVAVRARGPACLDAGVARRWCDRHTGIGADGLIEGYFTDAGLAMRLHNADGSRAELSGNGLRCLVAAAAARGLIAEGTLDVGTDAGPRRVTIALDPSGDTAWGSVDMGAVDVKGGTLADGVIAVVGNPHVVVADDGVAAAELVTRANELAGALAAGANVEFVTVLGPGQLSIRVVERGAGLTLACGTGSCAVAAVYAGLGLVRADHVTVANPGGNLDVTLRDGVATLSGPAARIATISMNEPW